MQRYNVFLMVHKGLRAMMYDTSVSLQHTDFGQTSYHPQSLDKLGITLDTIDAHGGHEDKFIFSLLQPCAPQLMEEMEAEHVTDHQLTAELRSLIAAYKDNSDPARRYALGMRICYTYNEFVAFNLRHLNKEEMIVNEELWKNYSDLEIVQANQRLVGSLKPEEARESAMWIMRSCSNMEISNWLNALKNSIPQPMFQMLMVLAEQELPPHRFEAVHDRITEVV